MSVYSLLYQLNKPAIRTSTMHNYEFLFYFIPRTTVVPDLVRITVVIPYEGFTVPKSHL